LTQRDINVAFGFIKSAQNSGASVTSLAITVQAVPVGALVVINLKFLAAVVNLSVTDNASTPNTYAQAVVSSLSGSDIMYQWYGVATTAGATTITASWLAAATARITVDQFNGGKLTNATVFDTATSNTGTGTSASLTLSPTATGELIVAGLGLNAGASSVVIGSNYLVGTNNTSTSTEYRQIGTTSEAAPINWTGSVAWAEVAGAYIPRNASSDFMQFM